MNTNRVRDSAFAFKMPLRQRQLQSPPHKALSDRSAGRGYILGYAVEYIAETSGDQRTQPIPAPEALSPLAAPRMVPEGFVSQAAGQRAEDA